MKLYLVRHGETEWNKEKRIQGQTDNPLDRKGICQALESRKYFCRMNFADVYSSPLIRALETADLIYPSGRNRIIVDNRLKEISYGTDEGMDLNAIDRTPSLRLYNYFHAPQYYNPPDSGESIGQLKERCRSFYQMMITRYHDSENVLVSSHGAWIRGMISVIEELPEKDFWNGKEQKNCSVTIIRSDGRKSCVVCDAIDPADMRAMA